VKPYAELEVFRAGELAMYRTAVELVSKLPTWDLDGRWVRCHEVVRAVAATVGFIDLRVRDGLYRGIDHSWLEVVCRPVVLDVYAVGQLPPVRLVDIRAGDFDPRALRGDIRHDVVELLRARMAS
jgi:hypothetical protein